MGVVFEDADIYANNQPVIDEATRKLAAAVRWGDDRTVRSSIECEWCGATGSKGSIILPDGKRVGSLAIHTLAFHREKFSDPELAVALALNNGEVEPDEYELNAPPRQRQSNAQLR